MPRQKRRKSESGIYHVMLRGINQQQIFEDEEDNEKYLEILKECKAISGYQIFAYCLMGNHIHLLIKEGQEEISQVFKRIGARFVYWYNWKYRRQGHLFQDRFKSEAVENDEYFLTVLRYIHQNPVKSKLVKNTKEYKYSSYNSYINQKDCTITDIETVLSMMSRDEFVEFNNMPNDDMCLDNNEIVRYSDKEAWEIISKISSCNNASEFQKLDKKTRDNIIKRLRRVPLSIRQISRLTGVSKGIIEGIQQDK